MWRKSLSFRGEGERAYGFIQGSCIKRTEKKKRADKMALSEVINIQRVFP